MAAGDDEDMPDMEELEWLESSTALYYDAADDDEYFHLDEVEAEDPETNRPQKRPRSPEDSSSLPVAPSGKGAEEPGVEVVLDRADSRKRAKDVRNAGGALDDEDWLRYSPPLEEPPETVAAPCEVPAVVEKTISRFASEIDGQCMPITGPDGQRVYAKLRPEKISSSSRRLAFRGKHSNGLLTEPFHAIERRVEQAALAKAMQESFHSQDPGSQPATSVGKQLWVEKYAPKAFTELLSDEHTNREVLLWLKQWDSCVFGSHLTNTSDESCWLESFKALTC